LVFRRRLNVAWAATAVALLTLAFTATAQARDVAPQGLVADAKAHPQKSFPVIVLWNGRGHRYGNVSRHFSLIDGEAAKVTGAQLLDLVAQPGVASVTPDAPVVPDAVSVPAQVWRDAAGISALPATADAPAIAVVDSGDAVGDNVTRIDLSGAPTDATDAFGHGTLVDGLAAGASAAYPGAAPGARIVSIKVVGSDGSARTSDVIAAADWIHDHAAQYGIRVANFSLHAAAPGSALVDPLDLAVRRLWLSGTVVVAAAGNEGSAQMLYAPANDPFVITVGAVGTGDTAAAADDAAAPWSSYGYTGDGFAKPELVAPGRMLVGPVPGDSVLAQALPDRVVAPGWMWMSGTSFAAPIVSGIAARLLALHPGWTPDQVKGSLMATATPLAGGLQTGVGEANAAAAAALPAPAAANGALEAFVHADASGQAAFDGDAWLAAVADASWASASWASASWASASWASASWASASWASASWASASWASASWASASWASASWASASWAS
jgi:serine protease AprX